MTTLLIPDLSEWQGEVDWKTLIDAAYPVVIIRAHNGTRVDHEFARNREQAHAHGVRALGLYQYLDPGINAADQAAEFVKAVSPLRAGEWPIVDCESGDNAAARVKEWLQYTARALGYEQPWGYSGAYFYGVQHLGDVIAHDRLWLAAYGPDRPADGEELWQYTDHRIVPGVSGPVDCSAFQGTADQLLAVINEGRTRGSGGGPTPGPTSSGTHPYPVGIHPGGTVPSARPLQQALKRTQWLAEDVVESDHYGPLTQAAVAGFNRKHGLSDAGVDPDPAIGPRGWALLMWLAYGTR